MANVFDMSCSLPVEILSTILNGVQDANSLASVCCNSRTLGGEAARILYRRVELTNRRMTDSFSETMVQSPALGERVHTLFLTIEGSSVFEPSPEDTYPLARILSSLPKLQHLTIKSNLQSLPMGYAPIFEHCPFQLAAFHNFPLAFTDTMEFLSSQPNIQGWTHLEPSEYAFMQNRSPPLDEQFLPRLLVVNIDAELLSAFRGSRPVTHARLRIFEIDEDACHAFLRDLRYVRDTLVSLMIDASHSSCETSDIFFVERVAREVPSLKHFALLDDNRSRIYEQDFSSDVFVDAISGFKNLVTFTYAPPKPNALLRTPRGSIHPAASAMLDGSSTLRRVSISQGGSIWACKPLPFDTYAKLPGGQIEEELNEPLDFESWRFLS
ncbi:hypothetical protein JAAARDRAFT_203491 [Jaapia argillacea MUCL 33604]|uniref:F-box domain-containing protein n=1 Tax=Jaapia argillacea MUCL 33604 TaxID=933084 RepID=A0A067QFN6_9AGAM|nr:hypothetical protein JAAARDRAFT_203491 [Jaapia argillacea MUCL 33604]